MTTTITQVVLCGHSIAKKFIVAFSVSVMIALCSHAQSMVCAGFQYEYTTDPDCSASEWRIVNGTGSLSFNGNYAWVTWSTSGALEAVGCTTFYVEVVAPPTVSVSGPTQIACGDNSGYTLSYQGSTNAATKYWYVPSNWTITSGQGTNQIWVHPNGDYPGNVTLYGFSNDGVCYNSNYVAVSEYSTSGALTISNSSGPASLCESQSGYYTAYAAGAASYSWQFTTSTGTVLASGSGTNLGDGSSGYWIYPSGTGSYRVKVQANPGTGCSQSSSSVGTMGVNVTHCGGGNRINSEPATMTFEDETNLEGISIFPNPAAKYLQVNFGSPVKDALIKITSLSAEIVANVKTNKQENRIGIEDVRNGIYIIEVVNGTSILRKKIFIKQ